MSLRATTILAVALLVAIAPAVSQADLASYSQDFEALVQGDSGALAADGWLVFGNVFDPAFNYLYGYGPFPAPNNAGAFCGIAAGEGGPTQGAQQLVVYSDYANTDHGIGNQIESNVFHEQVVGAANVGETWEFRFDAKRGDLVAPATAIAFIKTLDPNSGYAITNFITLDTSALGVTWGTYTLSLVIDGSLDGQILQFGFANTCTNYTPSGVLYDNINFDVMGSVSVDASSWARTKALYR